MEAMSDDFRLYLDERFNGLREQLERIEEHVMLTNGRVTKLEQQRIDMQRYIDLHPGTCPNLEKMRDTESRLEGLEKKLEDVMFFAKYPKLFIAGIVIVVILSIGTFISNSPLKQLHNFMDPPKIEQVK